MNFDLHSRTDIQVMVTCEVYKNQDTSQSHKDTTKVMCLTPERGDLVPEVTNTCKSSIRILAGMVKSKTKEKQSKASSSRSSKLQDGLCVCVYCRFRVSLQARGLYNATQV